MDPVKLAKLEEEMDLEIRAALVPGPGIEESVQLAMTCYYRGFDDGRNAILRANEIERQQQMIGEEGNARIRR